MGLGGSFWEHMGCVCPSCTDLMHLVMLTKKVDCGNCLVLDQYFRLFSGSGMPRVNDLDLSKGSQGQWN